MGGKKFVAALQRLICACAILGLICSCLLMLIGWLLALPGSLVMAAAQWFGDGFDEDMTEAFEWLGKHR